MITSNQLYAEIKQLAPHIPAYHQLDQDNRISILTDTFLSIQKKMIDGKIPSDTYNNYKDYMFISLKNNIMKRHNWRNKTLKGQQSQNWMEELPPSLLPSNNQNSVIISQYKQILNLIPIDHKAMLRWYYRGWTILEVANAFGCSKSNVDRIFRKTRKLLIKIVNDSDTMTI